MAVQLMTNVKDWSTVTEAGGETMMGDPKKKNIKAIKRILNQLTASCFITHVLAIIFSIAMERPINSDIHI